LSSDQSIGERLHGEAWPLQQQQFISALSLSAKFSSLLMTLAAAPAKLAFISPLTRLPRRRRPRHNFCICACKAGPLASPSVLDAVPDALKLNAVAESLARSRDVCAALAVAQELRALGEQVRPRTLAALVDGIAARPGADAAKSLGKAFDAARPNGFGQAAETSTAFIAAFASRKQIASMNGPSAPADDDDSALPDASRRVDMGLAGAFLAVIGTSLSAEVLEPLFLHHSATEATTMLLLLMGGLAFDRFSAGGATWTRLSAGIDTLLSDDPAREARVEAAYFLVAYLLGLSCAPFQPDVRQILKLHSQDVSVPTNSKPPPPLEDTVVNTYLVWLLAGIAAEAMIDGKLVESDTGRARDLLQAISRRRMGSVGKAADDERIRAAYASA
jgi:hypothetical protein